MENNNQRLQDELYPLSEKANIQIRQLTQESGHIKESLEKLQHHFGDQVIGSTIMNELIYALSEVQDACCELEQIKGDIIVFSRELNN